MARYGFEAITTSVGMTMTIRSVGKGKVYLGQFEDTEGTWFDGSHTYELVVPPKSRSPSSGRSPCTTG